ncbi:MAG: LLM class flavin-dependent oxidoreductase [Sphingomonadales bacterium]|nr:LLM class flavin-dependent oxidoreductase [Sphingomonadales bacterium]
MSNRMHSANPLKIGLFGANCSNGLAATTVPERWEANWDNNLSLARMADEAGLEFMLPIARWRGFGGESHFQESVLETVTWAAGLLAATTGITVFATTHVSYFHPVVAAKQIATMDHIGGGRYGLNIVCGWSQAEFDMFGIKLSLETEGRYEYGQEWFDIVRKIWTSSEPFDWSGKYFNLRGVKGHPKPTGGVLPPIMNAGASGPGQDFGARNADSCFITMVSPEKGKMEVEAIKRSAKEKYLRDVTVSTNCYVVCRNTRKEAEEYHRYYTEECGDHEAAENLMSSLGVSSKSFSAEHYKLYKTRFLGGHGGYPIIGSPDDVADELEKISHAGYASVALSFVNYLNELPLFRDEVLTRLAARRVRA